MSIELADWLEAMDSSWEALGVTDAMITAAIVGFDYHEHCVRRACHGCAEPCGQCEAAA